VRYVCSCGNTVVWKVERELAPAVATAA
jgi:hypothetical protein